MKSITTQEAKQIAEEAYIYTFPMLMGYRFAFATFFTPGLPAYRGPANAVHGKAATLDHYYKDVVTPNADTPYSFAMLDFHAEPVASRCPRSPTAITSCSSKTCTAPMRLYWLTGNQFRCGHLPGCRAGLGWPSRG